MDGSALGVRPSAISSPHLRHAAPTSCRRSAKVGRTTGGAQSTVLALSLALGLISLITKLLLLPADFSGLVAGVRWLLRLLIIVSADLAFVLSLAWVCGLTTLVLGRWPRAQSTWRFVVLAVYAMAGLQAVASVPMLQTLVAPFSIRLVVLAGGPVMMTSSVLQHVSVPLVIGMLAALTALAAAPRVLARWAWFRALARNPLPVAGVATFLILAFYTACQYYIATHWTDPKRWERRIAQSPQAVMLISCLEELVKPEPFTQAFSFSESDDSDFADAWPAGAAQQSPIEIPVEKRPRNLLLVILESTAAEYLSIYGGKHPTTPRLERLASENGLVFENVYAQAPASWKSLIGLLASTYCRPDWRMIVEDCPNFDVPTLPEVLARRGFGTCFLHAGYWDWRGGEQFLKRRGVQTLIDAHQLPSAPVNSWGTSDRAMLQRALEWIDVHRDTPFFVCACTIETHHPYAPVAQPHDFGVADADFNRYLNALRRRTGTPT